MLKMSATYKGHTIQKAKNRLGDTVYNIIDPQGKKLETADSVKSAEALIRGSLPYENITIVDSKDAFKKEGV
jgi:hypothetical protein